MKISPIYINCGISGFESPASDLADMDLSLDDLLIKNKNSTFFGVASGNSMRGAGIDTGDILIIDRNVDVKDLSVVVVNLNGEFTCKILDKKNKRLLSASKDYPPVMITEADVFQLEGSVVASVRRYDDPLKLSEFM